MIELISEIGRKGSGQYALLDDSLIRGSLHIVNTVSELSDIPEDVRKIGMLTLVKQPTPALYILTEDANEPWQQFATGASGGSCDAWVYTFSEGLKTTTEMSTYTKIISLDESKTFNITSNYSALPETSSGIFYCMNDYIDGVTGDTLEAGFYQYNSITTKWEQVYIGGKKFENREILEKFSKDLNDNLVWDGNPVGKVFENEETLEKFNVNNDGKLTWDGNEVGGSGENNIDDFSTTATNKTWSAKKIKDTIDENIPDNIEVLKKLNVNNKNELMYNGDVLFDDVVDDEDISKKRTWSSFYLDKEFTKVDTKFSPALEKAHTHDNKSILDNITADAETPVSYASQTLTPEQQAQARSNIGAGTSNSTAPNDAEKNIIVGVQKNGTDLTPDPDRKVNITVPTQASDIGAVAAVAGKGLSTNDLTESLKASYDGAVTHASSAHAPSNAERNVIVGIQRNGTDLTPDANRKVNISVPTVDTVLSATSTNPVQNKVIQAALSKSSVTPSGLGISELGSNANLNNCTDGVYHIYTQVQTAVISSWLNKPEPSYNHGEAAVWWIYFGSSGSTIYGQQWFSSNYSSGDGKGYGYWMRQKNASGWSSWRRIC